MVPKELDELIKEYLTDGIITSKERQVLLKKAQQMGLDVDEIDLYIDAQQQKVDQAAEATKRKARGKSCPFCGAVIPLLADKCPECGKAITPEASKELEEIFDNLENALVEFKSGKDIGKNKANVERYVRKARTYYENNPKVQKLLAEIEEEKENAVNEARKQAVFSMLKKAAPTIGFITFLGLLYFCAFYYFDPSPSNVINKVQSALEDGDIVKAQSYCADYVKNHHYSDAADEIMGAFDAIISYQSSQVSAYVDEEDLSSASKYLSEMQICLSGFFGTSTILKKYDSMYFSVINEYIKKGELDSAESLALTYRSKIDNDLYWLDSSCYKTLKSTFKKEGRDFSTLKSKYDSDDK